MRKAIVVSGKFLLAAFLIVYMARSGNLDLTKVEGAFARPIPLLAGAGAVVIIMLLSAVRWHQLLLLQQIKIRFRETLAFSLVGNFFSTVTPGAVSGDVVKAYYVVRRAGGRQAAVALSVGADRFLGMLSLFLMALVATALNWRKISSQPMLLQLAEVSSVLTVLSVILLALAIWGRGSWFSWLKLFRTSVLKTVTDSLSESLRHYSYFSRHSLTAGGASMGILLLLGLSFSCFGAALGVDNVSLMDYFFAAPFIILSMAIPITPAGIGVGQVVSAAVMGWIQGVDTSFGADMVTLLQMSRILVALSGTVVFLCLRSGLGNATSTLPAAADVRQSPPQGQVIEGSDRGTRS